MVRLLLARGADPDGACTCAGGETPLWVAVAQHETAIVDELLRHGADPNVVAFNGTSALEVAHMRGYDDLSRRLIQSGAQRSAASQEPAEVVCTSATGIKAIDLWCPFPERGLVHLTPRFGVGAIVLVSELSYRAVAAGRSVVWTGFVQAPTDLGDVHHALAESDLVEHVLLCMASPAASVEEQVASLDRGIRRARGNALLVVFAESGRLRFVDERLGALAARDGITLVVAPLDGSVEPPRRNGTPYVASVEFDLDRALRQRWPAIGPSSWSKVGDPEVVELAARARASMTDALDAYLSQPFYVAEPATGVPGESVPLEVLRERVAALLEPPGR
jgi:hypothetical protein